MNHLSFETVENRSRLIDGIENLLALTAAKGCEISDAETWEFGGIIEDELTRSERVRADFNFYADNWSDADAAVAALNNKSHPFPEEVQMLSGFSNEDDEDPVIDLS